MRTRPDWKAKDMKRTTKKLSGIGLELFLRRYFAGYQGIDDSFARQLAEDGVKTFSSVRVRRVAWCTWRRQQASPKAGTSSSQAAALTAQSATKPEASQPAPAPTPVSDAAPFDAYEIGLIPTFQREGAEGLLTKLASVTSTDNLRKMARVQQIALPAELRTPDADINAVRSAIVEAVGKRIANRRAAAG